MKKTLLFLALLLTGWVRADLGPNLVVNGNFEAGSSGWTQWWGGNSGLPEAIRERSGSIT